MKTMEERVAIMEHSLETGRKSFSDHDRRLAALEPKRVEWSRLLFAIFAAMLAAGTIVYTVAEKFSDRPRWDQLENVTKPLKEQQDEMSRTIRAIESSTGQQAQSFKSIERAQNELGRKLDQLLLPRERNR